MLDWLQNLDLSLFRFVNISLSNPIFDKVMPYFGDTPGFGLIVLAILLYLVIKGGVRGRIFVVVLLLGLGLCDGVLCNTLKHALGRLRPFNDVLDAHVLLGRGASGSMPSSHAGNWFAATMISFLFYRRSICFMLPLAMLVSFSRVYTGVHYPGDVLAGALIGAGSGVAVVLAVNALWRLVGARVFPIWHARQPTLFQEKDTGTQVPGDTSREWLRLGYLIIGVLFLVRIAYLAAGKIELSEDEAYQWLWSKHIALSYYSKPPLIACAQFLGTHLWGDTMFGVRFFSPVIAAILSVLLLRFMAREFSAKAGVLLLMVVSSTILMDLGATLMTIDPLSVLFWTSAMIAGWRASQPEGTTRQWLWVGLWMGLGFLSKYTSLFQWLCWIVFFALWPPARQHLRRPGPYLALLVNALCAVPVLIWNHQNGWITVEHVANDGKLGQPWHFSWSIFNNLGEFLGSEFGLLNPVFFVGMIWAAVGFWMGRKKAHLESEPRYLLQLFLFSMGVPLFLFYFLFSLHSRVLPNWIAPSVLPLFCLMSVYFGNRWDLLGKKIKPWLGAGVGIGLFAVVIGHETDLLTKILHRPLPSRLDVLHRVRGWEYMAGVVGKARAKMEAEEGKPTFIIGGHYGITSLLNFYLPEAKAQTQNGAESLIYFPTRLHAENQFFYWPGYLDRTGQNAIYVHNLGQPALARDWLQKWWAGRNDYYTTNKNVLPQPPFDMQFQFESVTDLGVEDIYYEGRLMHRVQLFACKNLRKPAEMKPY